RTHMASESMKAKLVLLGDGGVGKTSLIRRFVVDQYSDEYITTIGTKVSKRSLSLGHPAAEVEMAMQIWDVLGQKGYSGVQETAMKGAQGVLHGLRCDGRREPSECARHPAARTDRSARPGHGQDRDRCLLRDGRRRNRDADRQAATRPRRDRRAGPHRRGDSQPH